jgi:hypothetical protein
MNAETTGAKLELMKHVERAVRPVVASWKQKMQMRADLLARLTALYEQEFARLGDAQAAVLQATQRLGSAVDLSSQLQRSVPRRTYWEWKLAQTLFGRLEDPPFSRAARAAATVVLILLLACAARPLFVLAGLVPEEFPFSWSGAGEELLVKPAGIFVVMLFLSLERRLIQVQRRGLALTLAAATGPLVFLMAVMGFGAARVFNMAALNDEAVAAWVGLIAVPIIMLGVTMGMETVWRQIGEWGDLSIE